MEKAPEAFRTISEAAEELDVPQHVLRFWETRFAQIRPLKRGGGRRYYRPEDVDLLRGIRHLLYGKGYTIRGVQRILKEQGVRFVMDCWRAGIGAGARPQAEMQPAEDEAGPEKQRHSGSAGQLSRLFDAMSRPVEQVHDQGRPSGAQPEDPGSAAPAGAAEPHGSRRSPARAEERPTESETLRRLGSRPSIPEPAACRPPVDTSAEATRSAAEAPACTLRSGPTASGSATASGLSGDGVRRLHAVLSELQDIKRILDRET